MNSANKPRGGTDVERPAKAGTDRIGDASFRKSREEDPCPGGFFLPEGQATASLTSSPQTVQVPRTRQVRTGPESRPLRVHDIQIKPRASGCAAKPVSGDISRALLTSPVGTSHKAQRRRSSRTLTAALHRECARSGENVNVADEEGSGARLLPEHGAPGYAGGTAAPGATTSSVQ